ncbi:MAG: hypothetical protein HZB56_11775 [Deltaproteobacteria bacterium]|nr:hypothetical protein [Deltaproteobacteria bacterium]
MPLCQRAESSCGACCGLYNRADHSREALQELLDRRTDRVRAAPRTAAGFAEAAADLARQGDGEPLFPTVRICPLLGWLDESRTRVGCLAHPAVCGQDLRDQGAYDAGICETFLCPSHGHFSVEEADLVGAVCGADPYLYGLTVTDVDFVRACLRAVAQLCGDEVRARHLAHAPFRAALRRLFQLKEELAPGSDGLYGAFRPGVDGEPVDRQIDYQALARPRSPHDLILRCIGADPRSGNDLDAIEETLGRRLDGCVEAFPAPGPSARPAPYPPAPYPE